MLENIPSVWMSLNPNLFIYLFIYFVEDVSKSHDLLLDDFLYRWLVSTYFFRERDEG